MLPSFMFIPSITLPNLSITDVPLPALRHPKVILVTANFFPKGEIFTLRKKSRKIFACNRGLSAAVIFLIDLFVGTYRLSSHARLEAFVIQTKLN